VRTLLRGTGTGKDTGKRNNQGACHSMWNTEFEVLFDGSSRRFHHSNREYQGMRFYLKANPLSVMNALPLRR
jgi:hypothetical protein